MPFLISALNGDKEELSPSLHHATMTSQPLPTRTLRRAQRISAGLSDNPSSEGTLDDSLLAGYRHETTLSARNRSNGSRIISTKSPIKNSKKEYVGR